MCFRRSSPSRQAPEMMWAKTSTRSIDSRNSTVVMAAFCPARAEMGETLLSVRASAIGANKQPRN